MKDIEIKDLQNTAQNMIVGSKQHALFNPVIHNNPNLVTPKQTEIGHAEINMQIDQSNNSAPTALVQMNIEKGLGCCSEVGGQVPGMDNAGGQVPSMDVDGGLGNHSGGNLNSHLHGYLKPCPKQFGTQTTEPKMDMDYEDHSEY